MNDYDAIIVGAGHNGLTAGLVLARSGLRALVVERNRYVGGMASSQELWKGFTFNVGAWALLVLPDQMIDELGLAEHGLEQRHVIGKVVDLVDGPVQETVTLEEPVLARLEGSMGVKVEDYINARRRMTIARKTIGEAFTDIDLYISPTVALPPHRIDDALNNPPDEMRIIRNTLQNNALGNPAISVPCGFTEAGLPIGLGLYAKAFEETLLLRAAQAYEDATDWHRRRPDLAWIG